MKEQIENLLRLQSIDLRLRELGKDLEELPSQTRAAEREIESKREELRGMEEEIEKGTIRRRQTESALESNNEKIKNFNRQLFEVKTNREYTALENEIRALRDENSALEERILNDMEQLEDLEKRKSALELEVKTAEKKRDEIKERVDAETRRLGSAIEEVEKERTIAAQDIDGKLLVRYEKIRRVKEGIAIARIDRDACQVCYRTIPPQRIIEVRKMEKMFACEGCGRILVCLD